MTNYTYEGINVLALDNPSQIEYNRRKNVEQDNAINTLKNEVSTLITQNPKGFLPSVYYGLTRGNKTYRFTANTELTINGLVGNIGDSYSFRSDTQNSDYIFATGIKTAENTIKIQIQGDYLVKATSFTIVNMRTGNALVYTLATALTLQNASSLSDYDAEKLQGKQVTVIKDVELNLNNIIFASLDLNGDNKFNWVNIGHFTSGTDGKSVYNVTATTIATIINKAKVGDLLVAGANFTYGNTNFNTGDLATITSLTPLTFYINGNIRGATGETGATGEKGQDGTNGLTPTIRDSYWYIGGTSTGVLALGSNGADGTNGQSFNIQSGIYSTLSNYGKNGNKGPYNEVLKQLPTLPLTDSGKGYIVYDPLTTPLQPYYDLYYANAGDTNWTKIHPFTSVTGRDGINGHTPYINNGVWYINGKSTGVSATGPQGPKGDNGSSSSLKKSVSIPSSEWGPINNSAKSPFEFYYTFYMPELETDITLELINDNPVLYANYGFQIGEIDTINYGRPIVEIWATDKPTTSVTLTFEVINNG